MVYKYDEKQETKNNAITKQKREYNKGIKYSEWKNDMRKTNTILRLIAHWNIKTNTIIINNHDIFAENVLGKLQKLGDIFFVLIIVLYGFSRYWGYLFSIGLLAYAENPYRTWKKKWITIKFFKFGGLGFGLKLLVLK